MADATPARGHPADVASVPPGSTVTRGDPPRRTVLVVAGLFVLAVLLAFLVPDWGVLLPDTKPELYLNPGRMLAREVSAWRTVPALGSPNYHPGIAPITAVVWALQALGLPPWASQRVLAIVLTLVGAGGAGLLARDLGRDHHLTPVVVGMAYAIHPYAIVAGATLPIRLPHALLPWFALAAIRALRRGGWPWAAATAVAYAGMGGINGGVVNLLLALALPAVAVVVVRVDDVPVATVLRRCGLVAMLCIAVSIYWLVPTLLAAGTTGTDVAAATESPAAVAGTSSPIETLRGLGLWTLYLVIGGRPEVPGQVTYLTDVVPATATLALPVVAAAGLVLARRRVRVFAVVLLAGALPLMVGLYAGPTRSPLGRVLAWAFDTVPGAIGFRTTNKAGSLLALAVALLVGAAVAGRVRGRSLAPVVVGLVALAAWPWWVGDAQPVTLDVPDHWEAAAAELDTADPGRLLFAPGAFLARYEWGYTGVDDLDTALFDRREVAWRPTVPAGSRPAHNELTAVDVGMNDGALSPAATAAHLALLGVDDVLVRADSRNVVDGARPADELLAAYRAVGGATVAGTWGPATVQRDAFGTEVARQPALVDVRVPGNQPARVTPLRDALVATGDAFAIAPMADAGLDPAGRTLAWLDELGPSDLGGLLDDGARLVLTDTNQRRRWDVRGVGRSHSIVLPPDTEVDPATTRMRDLDPATQTTAFIQGGVAVTSSDDDPQLFRIDATTPATFASDGDPGTAWLTGAFDTEADSWIRLDYGDPVALDDVSIVVDTSGSRRPGTLLVEVAGADPTIVDVPDDGVVELDLPGRSPWIEVRIAEATRSGDSPVGIVDISVGGRFLRWGMRLPDPVADGLTGDRAAALSAAPTTVLLTRQQGDPTDPFDDEERGLLRAFMLPGAHDVDVTATVRPAGPPDALVAAAADVRGADLATLDPTELGALGRASQAFDGDHDTAWRPAGAGGRLAITLERPTRLARLVVRRPDDATEVLARLQVDDVEVEAPLVGPATTIDLPEPVVARTITLDLAAPGLVGQVAPITELEVPGIRSTSLDLATRLTGCAPVGVVDDQPIAVAVDLALGATLDGSPREVDGCSPLTLAAGPHVYDAGFGWTIDRLAFASDGPDGDQAATIGRVTVAPRSGPEDPERILEVESSAPGMLSTGIAWDPRWRATVDGVDLGAPRQAAGYAVGWPLPAGRHEVVLTYGPQRAVDVGFRLSAVAVLVLVVVAASGLRRRWRR